MKKISQPAQDCVSNSAPSKAIEVSAGLVFRNGQLLITQRYADSHLGGLWEFPGGKREPQETFEECLVRELREELGIEVDVGDLVQSLTHAYPEKTVLLNFFHCRWKANEPQTLGCAAFKWIGAADLRHHEFPAADAQLVEWLLNTDSVWSQPGK